MTFAAEMFKAVIQTRRRRAKTFKADVQRPPPSGNPERVPPAMLAFCPCAERGTPDRPSGNTAGRPWFFTADRPDAHPPNYAPFAGGTEEA